MTTRITITAALGLALSVPLAATAFAQSYNAPAGIAAVTAPGGVEGRAALPNLIDAQGGSRALSPRGAYDEAFVTGSLRARRDEADRGRR
ncbi:hypothetical protein [uncultured Methylobacterium sp.]|uniref:hypothetical protein n=1 Tax=uncultured Methylobacterium sp. TaxID=157278 RepID=UPI0035CA7554